MPDRPTVKVHLGSRGGGSVHIGDRDISSSVTRVEIVTDRARGFTEAVVTLVNAEVDGEFPVRVDADTAALLVEFGWTPPSAPTTSAPATTEPVAHRLSDCVRKHPHAGPAILGG